MAVYNTISEPATGEFRDRGSKFLAFAHPVHSEEEVKQLLKKYKEEYPDARHHCMAFVMGENEASYRAQDDGEPSNSAGAPILGQIRSFELTNTFVIVIRYSSGTKLGVPGLINAYKTATKEALSAALIVEEETQIRTHVTCSIAQVDKLKAKVVKLGGRVENVTYAELCEMDISHAESNEQVATLIRQFLADQW